MDIQKEGSGSQGNEKEKKQNLVKLSIKSHHSDDSLFSNPYNYLENPNNYLDTPQKMSIESNISEKMRLGRRTSDLFDNLASQMIVQQPFPKRGRMSTEDYRFIQNQPRNKIFQLNRPSTDLIRQTEPISNRPSNQPVMMKVQQKQEQKQEQSGIEEEPKAISCKCYKSKCLQLYCQCFSKGVFCKKGECSCYSCRNIEQFKDRVQKSRESVLERNPEAFTNKLQVVGNTQAQKSLAYKKGCNCKKTLCFKKYCQCWNSGVKCTYLCKCQNCLNGGERQFKE